MKCTVEIGIILSPGNNCPNRHKVVVLTPFESIPSPRMHFIISLSILTVRLHITSLTFSSS